MRLLILMHWLLTPKPIAGQTRQHFDVDRRRLLKDAPIPALSAVVGFFLSTKVEREQWFPVNIPAA